MTILFGIVAVILGFSALCAIYRVARGPSILDRVLAVDVLLAIVGGALAADMVFNGHTNSLVILVATSVIGFIASVTVARFVTERK
ncbi:multisubunit sodium/proton antiporter, MrpF subunit [Arthrobacter subterraneus]|uniref:Multisubunit sodium/proton antiporter, MrpF subunit n=1 Tax=Arthrobacter subterraneus TaxID=335973 RepID=A0A1G8DEE4_9MICC|nr:monovalent cation/H+ antiporter complex subunit F [Arthrobacter subterraneus]SDH56097.1 multisubunit sodium/proton antiporter, MrpF subunit [Arthrobacter subterraneus]